MFPLCDVSIKKAGLVRTALPVSLQIGSVLLFHIHKNRDWLSLLGNTKESSVFVY